MTSWAELLTRTHPDDHVVQLYGDDDLLLAKNVSRYLAEGLSRGDGLVVIATPEHISAIRRHLVEDDPAAMLEAASVGTLVCLDATQTLASIHSEGRLDESRFRTVVGDVLGRVRARSATGCVRAFGEMVDLLWDQGRPEDVAFLEHLWNGLLRESACSLYCAYRIDLFHRDASPAALQSIIRSHDHVLAGSGTLLSGGRPRA